MAKKAHIYVFGDIYDYQGKDAEEYGMINLRSVVTVLNNNPDAEEITVHINSRGGDVTEGFAIYDALINSGKKIITSIEGKCCSIATVIALAGSVRSMNKNSEFMIHNAWADPYSMTGFNADDYEEMADFIREADDKLLALYVEKTGASEDDIREKMGEETFLSSDEALALGFITEIYEPLQAVAFLSQKVSKPKTNKMSKIKSLAAKAIAAIMALTGDEVQAAEIKLSDGNTIYYEGEMLAIGTEVFSDAEMTSPIADGTYTLESDMVITVTNGSVESIEDPEEDTADAQALQARVTELETENETLKAENLLAASTLTKVNARLATIKSTHTPNPSTKNKFTKTQGQESKKFIRPDKKGGTK